MDSETASRIQKLERTVDILTRHLLSTLLILNELITRIPDDQLPPNKFGIDKDIELLQQIKKLSKQ